MLRIAPFLIALTALLAPMGSVHAQASCGSTAECSPPSAFETGLQQELTTAGLNALVGAMTAVATRLIQGEPVAGAAWRGAVGGAVIYGGKRVAVEGFDGAGLVGRQLASVGGSVVRNAAAGRGMLDELVLPVGPVRLYVSPERGLTARVDVATVVASAAFVAAYDARLDLRESLSAGAMVFRASTPMPGMASAGAIAVWDAAITPDSEAQRLLAHERVHVLQYDQAFLGLDERLEEWLFDRGPRPGGLDARGGRSALDYFDFGALSMGLRSSLAFAVPYQARPWEREAYFLAQSAHPIGAGPTLHTH